MTQSHNPVEGDPLPRPQPIPDQESHNPSTAEQEAAGKDYGLTAAIAGIALRAEPEPSGNGDRVKAAVDRNDMLWELIETAQAHPVRSQDDPTLPPIVPKTRADALRGIYTNTVDDISDFVRKRIRSAADAEDLIQETFKHFIEDLDSFSRKGSAIGLLRVIARNLILDHIKLSRHGRMTPSETLLLMLEKDGEGEPASDDHWIQPEDALEHKELRKLLSSVLATLSKRQAAVLRLRFFLRYSIEETATELNKLFPDASYNEGSVKALQMRALGAAWGRITNQPVKSRPRYNS